MLTEAQLREVSIIKGSLELLLPKTEAILTELRSRSEQDPGVIDEVESLKDCIEGALGQTGNLVE